MVLFINACVREESRTRRLADCLLRQLTAEGRNALADEVKEVELIGLVLPKVDEAFINYRNELVEAGDYSDPIFDLAKDFAAADKIVIAAPFWDLSFPAILKQYLEQICVVGLTFYYENDIPKGLCKAKKLYYVTTAGGPIHNDEFGYGYVKSLAQAFFGIEVCELVKAEGLDIIDADVERIMRKAEEEMGYDSDYSDEALDYSC